MKVFLQLLFITAFFNYYISAASLSDLNDFEFSEIISMQCIDANQGSITFPNGDNFLERLNSEPKFQLIFEGNYFEGIETLCPKAKDRIELFDKFLDEFKPCLLDEVEFLPELIIAINTKGYEFMCKSDAKNMRKLIELSEQGNQCMVNVFSHMERIRDCAQEAVSANWMEFKKINETSVCGGLHSFTSCVKQTINNQCPDDATPRELLVEMANTFSAPCSACILAATSLLTMTFYFILTNVIS